MRSRYFGILLICLSISMQGQLIPCTDGMAGEYPCQGYDLVSRVDLETMGEPFLANDLWAWTDPETGVEYALLGLGTGTAFIELLDPEFPEFIGFLPTHTSPSIWRDLKVYQNHAYIVSEAQGHGLQVFDLTQLRDVVDPPVTFAETAHLSTFGSAHNIAIDEASGYAYPVGTNTFSGGPLFIDLSDPADPQPAGGYSDDGYTHDAQIVVYNGPDTEYQGRQLIFASNEDTFTIVDVEDKTDPELIAREGYVDSHYSHQGWLTEDHRYFLMNDETDELNEFFNTRTIIWDCLDLDAPVVIAEYFGPTLSSDHNLYIHDGLCYQANYQSGLRVLDLAEIGEGELTELGFFDVYPQNDFNGFDGSWSVYPFLESGNILISSQDRGLMVVRPSAPLSVDQADALEWTLWPNPSTGLVRLSFPKNRDGVYRLFDSMGRQVTEGRLTGQETVLDLSELSSGIYTVSVWSEQGIQSRRVILEGAVGAR